MTKKTYISKTVEAIPPSGIRKFFDIVYSMPDCISLGVGEPDFVTPWKISDSGIYAIKDGYTHYTPNRGLPELCNLIAAKIYNEIGVGYSPAEEIIITVGVSQALDLALRTIVDPGDEVIIFEPCYVSYPSNISLVYGVPVTISTWDKNGFEIDPADLRKAITKKTKAVLLNYPANPTGATLSRGVLEEIAKIAIENDLIVIADELYSAIVYEDQHFSILQIPGMKERTIYLNGFSKSHAMTGWRLGYVCAPKELIAPMLKIHQYTALCAPSMAQYAAIEAIENGDADVGRMIDEYTRRRNFITSRFNDIGIPCRKPKGTFYVFPDVSPTKMSSEDFAMNLLQSQKVAVVPGTVFGKSSAAHIRCSFATSIENLKGAMERIENFVKSL
jgi:aminotransferase